MRQRIFGIVGVLLLLWGVAVMTAQEQAPAAVEASVEAQKAEQEAAALKKQNAQLQSALAKATENQRKEDAKKALGTNATNVKNEIGASCKAAGGTWAFLQGTVNNANVTFIGCIGK